ncbi:sensor histidine kinase [Paenibacillus sp. GCM10023252]|uniref:sensor histidine kinase n=1 Tax=Paenibacillus sp. GCM10023252 TaxID=3252649 RepID=UPI003615760F
MLFVLIALWVVGTIMLVSDPQSAAMRRLSAVAYSGGAGALAAVLDLQLIPALEASDQSSTKLIELLTLLQSVSSLASYYIVPYAFLLFAMAYKPVELHSWKQDALPYVLFLPIALCLLFTPYYNERYPITFDIVVWWAVPYIITGAFLVLSKRLRHPALLRTHLVVCLSVLPPMLFCMTMNYILPSLGFLRMWVYNPWMVGMGVAVFVIGLFTYGFMGIRIFIDRRRMDSTLRAVTSGSAILNHAIKNDVGKMRLFLGHMTHYAEATNQPELLADIQAVQSASQHIHDMISRVHRRTEDLDLLLAATDIGQLITHTLKAHEPQLTRIRMSISIEEGWQVQVDAAQLGEAVNNLVSNAIEAMGGEGELAVRFSSSKRDLLIEIRDSGPGMDRKQIRRALEPFYTTKNSSGMNFGLGLPYAYHVMRKHKGSLYIRSKPGLGTSIFLSLPKRATSALRASLSNTLEAGRE